MRKFLLVAVGLCLLIGLQSANAGIVGDLGQCKAYNVNVIAYDKCPKSENSQRIAVLADFTSPITNGDPISVYLNNKENTILLLPAPTGESFRVLESNACDDDGAQFQLPSDTADTFYVFVRLVGEPGSKLQHFLCRTDTGTTTVICQSGLIRERFTGKGFPVFNNVTNELLQLPSGEQLFDTSGEDYFWVWNTQGRPHAQVWFIDQVCFDALQE